MSLTRPFTSQIDTSDIGSTEFSSTSELNSVSANLDSYSTYVNTNFSTGSSGFTPGALSSDLIRYTDSSNANSAYATTNVVSISGVVNSKNNLLVYLDGVLQHTDSYELVGSGIQFSNVDPIPSNVFVGIKYLKTPSILVSNTSSANSLISANGYILWDYESKRIYVYDGVTEGGFYANAIKTIPYAFQGSLSGYASGGDPGPVNTIDKFPFAADGNASDVGDLTQARGYIAGQSSDFSGYSSGGSPTLNTIDKFPFSANGNATDVGDLTQGRSDPAGQSSSVSGYSAGGYSLLNTIDKFPFSTNANASDVGDLTQGRARAAGQSSTTHGYSSGGKTQTSPTPVTVNTVDKFPFSTNANATDVGDLTISRQGPAGQSSTTNGYSSGGRGTAPTPYVNTIDKFPFASNEFATDVGDLSVTGGYASGQSSTVSGYTSGRVTPTSNVIDKFPFSSNANASDVGDLTVARYNLAGQQR